MATASTAPTKNGIALDQFNAGLRASPAWQQFIASAGYKLDGSPIKLTDYQRTALRVKLQQAGVTLPPGMEIDGAGNINQDQGWSKYKKPVLTGLAIGGAALATMGASGFGPLAGVLHGSAAALPGAANVGALSDLGALGLGSSALPSVATGAGVVGGAARGYGSFLGRNSSDLLRYGAPVVGGLIGAKMSANADRDASELEYRATQEALADAREDRQYQRGVAEEQRDYGRGQYGSYLERLEPYRASAQPALGRLESYLGGRPTVAPSGVAAPRTPTDTGQPTMITVTAPDGRTQQRPASELAHWQDVTSRLGGSVRA